MKSAKERIRKVATLYQDKHPKVADFIEEGAEETLTILALPEEHRKRLSTNNLLERLSQSIKQRTRTVRIFPNRHSLLRLVTAVLLEIHEDWITGHRYLKMSKNKCARGTFASGEEADANDESFKFAFTGHTAERSPSAGVCDCLKRNDDYINLQKKFDRVCPACGKEVKRIHGDNSFSDCHNR